MQTSKLIAMIKEHKGKLYVPVHSKYDTLHIAVEKSDLIATLSRFANETDCGYQMYQMDDGSWTVGAEH